MMVLLFRKLNDGSDALPPVVFIHGAMSSNLVWLLLARELVKTCPDRAFFLLDLPGHGESMEPPNARIEEYARAVIDFLDHEDIQQAALVGHSMGGAIAQQIAIDVPDRVERAAFLATGARLGVSPQIIEGLASQFDSATEMMGDFVFGPNADPALVAPSIRLMKQAGAETSIADFTACNAFDSVGRIDNLDVPAIVVCGEKDLMTSAKKNKRLAETIGCPYVELPGIGHMLQLEAPQKVAEILTGFFNRPE